jgi:hypothetical protein
MMRLKDFAVHGIGPETLALGVGIAQSDISSANTKYSRGFITFTGERGNLRNRSRYLQPVTSIS